MEDCKFASSKKMSSGQTVNQVFYKRVLERLREKVRRKRPEAWKSKPWFLHHENAPAHSALSVREFLTSKNIPVVPHLLYTPDLAPCDFFFVSETKKYPQRPQI
uniref:Mariner Mos1 transposase n=1 Tax=Sipha flava TaxID=143950 RepID=A0A2S2R501_9HEMI